jgi:hypothetical protein
MGAASGGIRANIEVVCKQQEKEKGGKLISFVVSIILFLFVGDALKSCHPEGIERMHKWKKK